MSEWPELPSEWQGMGGRISIVVTDATLHDGDHECFGLWVASTRTITIDGTEKRSHQWRSLFHELNHATLADTGLENLFDERVVEALCDGFATARYNEMAATL